MGTAKRYRVRCIDIRHNGQTYRPGDVITLADIDADRLAAYLMRMDTQEAVTPKKSKQRHTGETNEAENVSSDLD